MAERILHFIIRNEVGHHLASERIAAKISPQCIIDLILQLSMAFNESPNLLFPKLNILRHIGLETILQAAQDGFHHRFVIWHHMCFLFQHIYNNSQ